MKRNGKLMPFDKDKIIKAINAAIIEVDGELTDKFTAKDIADNIERYYLATNAIALIEDIQDTIEYELMSSGRKDVARSYIRYRYKKEVAREKRDDFINAIRKKLQGTVNERQNANVDELSFGGRTGEAISVAAKQLALEDIISPMARKNHEGNLIYIHDLDSYYIGSHNCLSVPFDKLLAEGFKTRQTDVRPAGSINTAFQLIAVIFQIQSLQQFGGVSATHLDWTMVPYVRKSFYKHYKDGLKYVSKLVTSEIVELLNTDKKMEDISINSSFYTDEDAYEYAWNMTVKETHQAAEGLYHNLNTLQSRSGNQLPFTSVNYGTCTLPEGRMVTKALLEASIEGLGAKHRTSIFPCGIFQCMKGVNRKPGDPNYDLYRLALESTSKRLYPNYANVDWSGNAGYDRSDPRTYFSTMGKRKLQLM